MSLPFLRLELGGRAKLSFLPFEWGRRVRSPFISNGADGQGYPFFQTEHKVDATLHFEQGGRVRLPFLPFEWGGRVILPFLSNGVDGLG